MAISQHFFCMKHFVLILLLSSAAWASAVDFESDIQPILKQHCFSCHGPEKQRDGVAFHLKSHAFRESDTGHAVIVPGKPEESWLIKMVTHENESSRMPKDKKPLSRDAIAALRTWILQGAGWPEDDPSDIHWAYVPPEKSPLPSVHNRAWPKHAIDFYSLARMEAKGFIPQPRADPETLLRRVYLDLTGLPPGLDAMDEFLKDPTVEHYERVVDRLLASPAFGERWAVHWLDLSRTADSDGYQRDGFRTVWPYRDYVIDAFNHDMPYTRFVTEQLAGDLIEHATLDQKVATVFSRNAPHNREAGTDIDEDRHKQIVDRVNTFGTVFLGSSLACAQCHTHKYDPYTINEYYEIFAFFNNTPIESRVIKDSAITTIGPTLTLDGPLAERLNGEKDRAEDAFIKAVSDALEVDNLESFEDALSKYKNAEKVPNQNAVRKRLQAAELLQNQLTIPVMRDMDIPRETTMFKRGNWKRPGNVVQPDVPAFLNEWPEGAPRNRLGLAQWVTADDNPLFARAAVNRYWAELFGQGIVTTLEDLGKQGTLPSHPELLDYLAVRFKETGYSTKQILREMVLSETYQQQSAAPPDLVKQDPANTWLARGPRFRINAEFVRDSILSISGLLSDKLGGPPVLPPQPENVWRVIGNVDNTYRTSKGEDRYRRGVYTIWRRHAHYPSFANFDAPSRSVCAVRRSRSNTPLQALTLMNDPVYVEAAQAFADKLCRGQGTNEEKLEAAFRLASSRHPSPDERAVLQEVLHENTGSEFDGWFSVATTLINMSSTITKD
jgi:hypothetical protein